MGTHIKPAFPPLYVTSALVSILAWAVPVQAEKIVALVDEHGHTIYVNAPDDVGDSRAIRNYRPVRSANSLPPGEVDKLVVKAASAKQVDPKLVHSIIQVESGYNPNAVSNKGAMGLMQLIPGTAKRFGVENPFDPLQNVQGGVSYLKYLLDMFKGDVTLSLAAYNAGENSVLRSGGVPAYRETQDYVRKVNSLYGSEVPAGQPAFKPAEPPKPSIYRYVDEQGIVHFTNGQEF
jgi:soluble lytic murein transglycosylase-like protein